MTNEGNVLTDSREINVKEKADSVGKTTGIAPKTISRRLSLTRAVLFFEQIVICFWAAFTIAIFAYALVRWNLSAIIPTSVFIAILGIISIFLLIMIWRGIKQFKMPSKGDAINRLDMAAVARPFGTLAAKQSIGQDDPESRALWESHLDQMNIAAAKIKTPAPKVRLSFVDPYALRLIALLACFSAVAFFPNKSLSEMLDVDQANLTDSIVSGPSFEGWAEPPIYTRKPSIYLKEDAANSNEQKNLKLPEKSIITLRFYGDQAAFAFEETVSEFKDSVLTVGEDPVGEVQFEVLQSGSISLSTPMGVARTWVIEMTPDTAPIITLTAPISRTLRGSMTIPFTASDDYGVSSGLVNIDLRLSDVDRRYGLRLDPEPQDPLSFDVPLPLTGQTTDFEETILEELATHPWAGLPVEISIDVQDEAGNIGSIVPEMVDLPGKRFFDDLAGAIAEQRRDLLWNRENARRVSQVLRTITHKPEDNFESSKGYLIVRTAIRRIEYNLDPALNDKMLSEISDLLWQAALLIEDGDLSDAEERLKRAQERLSEAMENGATKDEIAELMDDLRKATENYIKQLAENAEKNPERQQAQNGEGQEMTQDTLQQMMDEIQSLMEQGRMAEAQALLEQLREMMENMEVTQGGQGNGQDGEQSGQSGDELSDTLKEQEELADDTFKELQDQFNKNRQQQQAERNRESEQRSEGPDENDPSAQDQQEGQQGPGEGDQQQSGENGQDSDQQGQADNSQSGQEGEGQGAGEGNNEDGSGEADNGKALQDLAGRQEALREMLERQQQGLAGDNSEEGQAGLEALERAEQGMADAQGSLEDGDIAGALDNQADAMQALREGMTALDQGNRQAGDQSGEQNDGQSGEGQQDANQGRDPLGRPTGENGQSGPGDQVLQDDLRQSREILDEIRRRSGEQSRPKLELDYLKRLLERF